MGHPTLGALEETREEREWRETFCEFIECEIDEIIWNSEFLHPRYYEYLEDRSWQYPERWWRKMEEELTQQHEEQQQQQQQAVEEELEEWVIDNVGEGWDGDWEDFDEDWGLWDRVIIF